MGSFWQPWSEHKRFSGGFGGAVQRDGGDWVEALDGAHLENRLDPQGLYIADAGPSVRDPAMVGIGWLRPRPVESSTNYYNSAALVALPDSTAPTPPTSSGFMQTAPATGHEHRIPAAYMKELKAQKDAATAASSGGAARRTQQRQAKGQREHETEEESSKIPVDMSAEQYAQLSQARGNKYVELRQGAPIALTQQALPVGSNHRRKWKKKDYSSDSGSEDDDETYMPASNLVNLPGGGWGKAAGAGNLGGAGGSSGKR